MKRLLLIFALFLSFSSSSAVAAESWEDGLIRAYTGIVGSYNPSDGYNYAVYVDYPYWDAPYPYSVLKWNGETYENSVYYSNQIDLHVVIPNIYEQPVELQSVNFSYFVIKNGTGTTLPYVGSYTDSGYVIKVYRDTSFSPTSSYSVVTKFSKDGTTYEYLSNLTARGTLQ